MNEISEILNTFRWFRDNWLINESGGKELIDEYYKIAPEIVKKIEERKDKSEIYLYIWNNYLSRCYKHIIEEEYIDAKNLYQEMVNMLKNKYKN